MLESGPFAELHTEHAPSESNAAQVLNGSVLVSDQIAPPVTSPLGLVLLHLLMVPVWCYDFSFLDIRFIASELFACERFF